jgi:hypothetical protein
MLRQIEVMLEKIFKKTDLKFTRLNNNEMRLYEKIDPNSCNLNSN